jgi:hypothetical protein
MSRLHRITSKTDGILNYREQANALIERSLRDLTRIGTKTLQYSAITSASSATRQ